MNHRILSPSLALAFLIPLGAAPAAQRPQGADAPVSGAATVAVNEELGRSVGELQEIFSSNAYLSSLRGGLVAGAPDEEGVPPGKLFVEVGGLSSQLLSVRVTGASRDAVRDTLQILLAALPKLEPLTAADAKQEAEAADAELARRAKEADQALAARQAFVERNGPLDGEDAPSEYQRVLNERTLELEETRLKLATQLAMRDALKEQLTKEPATVEERREVANPKRRLLENQLEMITHMKPQSGADGRAADPMQLLEQQMKWIEGIEKQLASAELTNRVVVETTANPRRAEIEERLFEADREAASHKARESSLAKTCESLRAEASRIWKLRREWEAIQGACDRSAGTLEMAEVRSREAGEKARRYVGGAWIRVIAGPRVD